MVFWRPAALLRFRARGLQKGDPQAIADLYDRFGKLGFWTVGFAGVSGRMDRIFGLTYETIRHCSWILSATW